MTNVHRLASLLAPRSVALVGASPRPGSIGNDMIAVLRDNGFAGDIHLVNPKYDTIDGVPCHASIGAIGSPPDLAVLGVGTRQIEPTFDDALAAGAGAIVLFDGLFDKADAGPALRARLAAKAAQAGVPVLGGNGMGYYNFDARTHVSFQAPPDRKPGGISLIAHSGSVFVLLAANDPRYRFNLIVSPGQEINASVSDYMDYALAMPTTRVLALFLETVRDPAGFVAALEKARERDVPVVVLKVGRTEASARFAATHSGAIAGDDAAYEAVFERYGVARVATLDQLMATAQLLAHAKRPRNGGLVALTDSGGLRELMIDLADDLGVGFAALAPATTAKLEARLPGHLAPINPVDAAGSLTPEFTAIFDDCLGHLMADANAAIGLFEFEARDDFQYLPAFVDVALRRAETHDTPLVVMSSFSGTRNWGIAERLADAGVPLVNGVQSARDAVRHCLAYRGLPRARRDAAADRSAGRRRRPLARPARRRRRARRGREPRAAARLRRRRSGTAHRRGPGGGARRGRGARLSAGHEDRGGRHPTQDRGRWGSPRPRRRRRGGPRLGRPRRAPRAARESRADDRRRRRARLRHGQRCPIRADRADRERRPADRGSARPRLPRSRRSMGRKRGV